MQSDEIRSRFLKFFKKRGHKIIPSASLVPENDPSVLFTTAGMQQFKPYYTSPESADKDFNSRNVVTVQKCIRTGDIDEVGDATHLTFFEMLGNFSFGGYGRKEAIIYAYDFITKELGLEISYVTVYKGEGIVPKDEESEKAWMELGVKDIREDGSDVFWGPTGDSGPCGPTTEIYCKNADGLDVEIWNIVFNEYFSNVSRDKLDKGEGSLKKLDVLGIDTGMGLERLVSIVQKKKSVYDTDLFHNEESRENRIVADHLKASLFIISEGIVPAQHGRGSILRNLIRRAIKNAYILDFNDIYDLNYNIISIIGAYKNSPYVLNKQESINIVSDEINLFETSEEYRDKILEKFEKYLKGQGKSPLTIRDYTPGKSMEKADNPFISGVDAYEMYSTYGIPIEEIKYLARRLNYVLDEKSFDEEVKIGKHKHQELSRTASAGMFKGGLANHNEKTIRLHTAHHLLLAGLQAIVSPTIKQRGSNITEERLRIDFMCDHKLTDEEKKKVEDWVNDKIKRGLNVVRREMPLVEAEKLGAEMEFGAKYPDIVSIYFIEDKDGNIISKEFCGGPHVENTGELGTFKIQKEEAVAAGIRRIKAILL